MDVTPQVFTTDYIGEPGERTFYVQTRAEETTHSYLIEKQQVSALADRLRDLLMMIDEQDTIRSAPPARDPALKLDQPVEPEWRIGTMGLAYDEAEDSVVVVIQPVEEGEELEETDDSTVFETESEKTVRFRIRRDQARSFILHALAVVEEGRPTCQLCGLPMNPSGHVCPASNGHHVTA
jgi:uncharacterized repeat protein (TIGR03847 family)